MPRDRVPVQVRREVVLAAVRPVHLHVDYPPTTKAIHDRVYGKFDGNVWPYFHRVLADLKALEKQGKVKRLTKKPATWERVDAHLTSNG